MSAPSWKSVSLRSLSLKSLSLRGRLAATIALATVAILIVGGAMSYVHAQTKIAVEMNSARSVALNGIARLIAELPASAHPQRDLEGLVRTFNGDRHVRVLLIDAFGQVRFQSQLSPPGISVPVSFEAFLAPPRRSDIIPLPGNAAPVVAAMLVVVPINEIAEVWSALLLDLTMLALFLALAFGLVFAVVGRSLLPLRDLATAFHRIGKGDYSVAVPTGGPPELAALSRGCNEMAARLEAMAARNRRLSEQLMRLQDEERADLARDLHDDVGPFLFAIDVDATTIAAMVEDGADGAKGRDGEIAERTSAIRQSARHARLQVRRILGTLRPGLLPGIGLKATLEHLVAGCRARHPEILFRLDVPEEDFGTEIEALLHRVVREALNNALRHGRPSTVSIAIFEDAAAIAFWIVDDGGGWAGGEADVASGGGYGLIGMRERVEAMGGRLSISEVGLPPGISVRGAVPAKSVDASGTAGEGLSLSPRNPATASASSHAPGRAVEAA